MEFKHVQGGCIACGEEDDTPTEIQTPADRLAEAQAKSAYWKNQIDLFDRERQLAKDDRSP